MEVWRSGGTSGVAIWTYGGPEGLEAHCRSGDVKVLMERGRTRAARMQVWKQREVNNAFHLDRFFSSYRGVRSVTEGKCEEKIIVQHGKCVEK